MTIQRIKIREFKKLKDINQEFNGNLILVKGENEVGKTSFIQFIQICLGNQKVIPPNIQGGGSMTIDIKGRTYQLDLEFKNGKPVVTITSPDGMKSNTKSALAGIVGAVEFDIDEFVEQSRSEKGRKQQIETFKSFLSKEVRDELATIEDNIKFNFDQRTEIGREVTRVKSLIEKHQLLNEVVNDVDLKQYQPVDVTELFKQVAAANERASLRERAITATENHNAKIQSNDERIQKLYAEIEMLKSDSEHSRGELSKIDKWLNDNPAIDVTEINQKIEQANDINNKAALAKELLDLKSQYERVQMQYGEMTAQIDTERQMLADAIKDMDTPVSGLMYNDEGLVYDGYPVHPESLSKSQIMELGVKLKLAENSDLGIILLKEGESIGEARLMEIMNIAKANDCQIIMEQVERGMENLTIEVQQF